MYANQYLANVRHDELRQSAAQCRLAARTRHQHSPQPQRATPQPPNPRASAGTAIRQAVRHGRLAAALAVIISGLLASVAAATAAFANPIPIGDGGALPITPVPPATVHVISTGGIAGWQIALIAAAAALAAAAAAVFVDRRLASRRRAATA